MTENTISADVKKGYTGKPLQLTTYDEKVRDKNAWGKATMKYYIDQATYGSNPNFSMKEFSDKQSLYDAYNNNIPQSLFDYVVDPLKAKQDKHKGFPAKIRGYNILRPNIDLLIGEWNKRPFYYDVVNIDGDDAINSFTMHKEKMFKDNVTQRFINTINELSQKEGQEPTDVPSEEIPDPKTLTSELNISYKDAKALKGFRALKVLELELKIRETWRKLFKDWLIAGEMYTLKLPMHGDIMYMRLSTTAVDYGKSAMTSPVEDSDYASIRFKATPAEITSLFYDKLKKEDVIDIEKDSSLSYTQKIFNVFTNGAVSNTTNKPENYTDKLDLYYVCWKADKTVGYLKYLDPFSQQPQYDIVDEDYKPNKEAGEEVEWLIVKEVWHGWRIGDHANGKYIGIEAIPAQRNEMNNFAACKLPINGKRFSDTECENISVLWLGMPYQILYIILMYRMEITIAKSKGKIFLLDSNVVNDEEDMEETFYYSEALGYMLIDPKKGSNGFNQYGVHDMSLYKDIKELIGLMQFIKSEWDELVGITRQRKGQNTSSDGLGVTEQAIFRSSVISDLIFTGFEEFLESELTGLFDNSKYAWADGKKGYYRNDDGRLELLALEPDDYCNSQLGIHVQNMSSYLDKFNMLKQQINAIAQRKDVKTSTIIDLTFTESLTELKALVKKAEAIEQQIIDRTAENEQAAIADREESQKRWEVFMNSLEINRQEKEWDRRDNNEYIKASLNQETPEGETSNAPNAADMQKAATDRLKVLNEASDNRAKVRLEEDWQQIEREKMKSQEKIAKDNNKTKIKIKPKTVKK